MNTTEMKTFLDQMSALGIGSGERIFVHASYKKGGYKALSPEDIVAALKTLVGKNGTIGMPAFTFSTSRENAFDLQKSPCVTGIISETFRQSDNVRRSISPTHSCCFWGADAEYCASAKMYERPFSQNGPFGKLYELGFKIVMLNCGMAPNSTLHAIEDWANLPYVRNGIQISFRKLGDEEGELQTHMPIGHRDFYTNKESKYTTLLRQSDVLREGKVLGGIVHIMPVRKMVAVCMAELNKSPDLFICDDPKCSSCKSNRYDMDDWKHKGATHWDQIWLGAAKTDITPGVGSLTNQGWGAGEPCEGVRNNLFARVLVFRKKYEYYAVVSLDLIRNNRARELEKAIYQKTKIPPERILVSCTHTHTGPAMGRDTFKKGNAVVDESYIGFLHHKVAGAVYEAKRNLQPVSMSHSRLSVDIGNINRDVRQADGSLKYYDRCADCQEPNGPVAQDFSMYSFKNTSGNTIAGIGHYACHPIFSSPYACEICSDYPGYFSEYSEKVLGDGTVVCFLQGALGNQMPREYGSTFRNAEKAGRILSQMFLLQTLEETAEPLLEIEICKREHTSPYMKPSRQFELAVLKLNQCKFGYGGGELYYQLAERFREKTQDPDAVWVGLTDDRMYHPDREAFSHDLYEVRMAKSVMGCQPGVGEDIVDTCASLFADMRHL